MRLIDADALMTEFMDSDLDHLQRDDWKEVIQIVTDAPTITPEPHWIPVTERLPQANEEVLITLSSGDIITIGWINKDGGWLIYDGDGNADINDILAWQPLPEPYKGGG